MILKADQKSAVSLAGRDEVGNPAPLGDDFTFEFTLDDPQSVVNFTDNGDGTGVVAATGTLGTATLDVDATRTSDGQAYHGTAAIDVVAGDVEAISVEFGTPEEVTPDTPPTP